MRGSVATPQTELCADDEQLIRSRGIALDECSDALESNHRAAERAPHTEEVHGTARVVSHSIHAPAAEAGFHGGDPSTQPASVRNRSVHVSGSSGIREQQRVRPFPVQRLQDGAERCHLRIVPDQVPLLEPPEPARDGVRPTGCLKCGPDTAEQQGRSITVTGELGMVERRGEVTVRLEPGRCPVVQSTHHLRLGPLEVGSQHLRQEMVAAVPVTRCDRAARSAGWTSRTTRATPASPTMPSRRRTAAHTSDRGSRFASTDW